MVQRIQVVRQIVILTQVDDAIVVEIIAIHQLGRVHVVTQEGREGVATNVQVQPPVLVQIQPREDPVALVGRTREETQGIAVFGPVRPGVQIIIILDQGKTVVRVATHRKPQRGALEQREICGVIGRHVEPFESKLGLLGHGSLEVHIVRRAPAFVTRATS